VDLFNSQRVLLVIGADLVGYCCIIINDEFAFNLFFFSIYFLGDFGGRGYEASEGSEDDQISGWFYLQTVGSNVMKYQ